MLEHRLLWVRQPVMVFVTLKIKWNFKILALMFNRPTSESTAACCCEFSPVGFSGSCGFMRFIFWLFCLALFTVQQTPLCTHRTDESLLQRRPAGVCGHSSDLWQIPRKERRTEGALWKRPSKLFFPCKVLGECKCSYISGWWRWCRKPSLSFCSLWIVFSSSSRSSLLTGCKQPVNVSRMHSAGFGLA